jgi:hypothetical protein
LNEFYRIIYCIQTSETLTVEQKILIVATSLALPPTTFHPGGGEAG